MNQIELKEFLDEKYNQYNRPSFIETDPIQIPHCYSDINDIEISAFLVSTIAWGQRKTIIQNGKKMMKMFGISPYDFIIHANSKHFEAVNNFVHRTFNGIDFIFFLQSLQNIYKNHNGLKLFFENEYQKTHDLKNIFIQFRKLFFEIPYPERTTKHISNIEKNSSGKRLNLFLMWMVRNDNRGVHFGLWNKINPSDLYMPLDIHSGNISRKLGLLSRKQNDWFAVDELTNRLKFFDASDPVKYDFALFGLGVFEKF